ncbi:cilia- and flagella-associated protein 69-like [Diorhabda carinulata]|uniref:cilia- and flagella-associated protein 69-like n=1 Tax=Diorhabda carinulata TaxID=1163345 RepID=UPI0025A17C53|nr:cilia- and flagella-associated protein 69-like [Diorhabda carinulata]
MDQTYCACSYPTKPSDLLNKIINLLECEITKNDERVIELLWCYIASAKIGFMIVDLPNLMTLLEILSERFKQIPEFGDILKSLLAICKIPIRLRVSSDVLRFDNDLQEYFAVLGYVLLRVEEVNFRKIVLDTIVTILELRNEKDKNQVILKKRRRASVSGRFPGILAQILFIIDDELFPKALDLTFSLISEFPEICGKMTKEDILNTLLIRLEDNWRNIYPDVPMCDPPDITPSFTNLRMITSIINLIALYLSAHTELLPNVPMVTRFSLWHLRYVYIYVTKVRNTPARNLVMTCIIWIVDLFPDSEFVPSGLARDFLRSSCEASEDFIRDTILLRIKPLIPLDDFIFLKLFICFIPVYLKYSGGKGILEQNRIMYRILKIISHPSQENSNPKEHACVIKILSYKMLNILVPHLEDEFIENSGPTILIKNLKQNVSSESGLILLSKCLDTLRKTLQEDPRKVVLNSVLFNNGCDVIIEVSRKLLTYEIFSEKAQICIQEAFHILSIIYGHCKVSNSTDSVDLTIEYLKRLLKQKHKEPVYDNRIIIAIMDFIWEVIVNNDELTQHFLKHHGVFLMLDFLQVYPLAVKIITLGALVDLCDFSKGKSIPYMITWTGKNGKTLIPLLMDIFRNENKELGVQIGPNGVIADGRYPLMGKDQYKSTFENKNIGENPSMADMYASCRPKIYALLCLIYDRYGDVFEIANGSYKTCNENLSTEDRMTLLLAENFLGLKFGEIWEELKVEFEMMEFEPLPIDRMVIDALVERTHRWGAHLKEVQEDLLKDGLVDNLMDEQETYRNLNDARITQALESINEAKYLARCTERMFRIAQAYKQVAQVEKSMDHINASPEFHQTFSTRSRVTPIFKQNMCVVEEKPEDDDVSLILSNESKSTFAFIDLL